MFQLQIKLFLDWQRDDFHRGVINPCTYIPRRQYSGYFDGPYQQAHAHYAQLSSGQLSCRRHCLHCVHRNN